VVGDFRDFILVREIISLLYDVLLSKDIINTTNKYYCKLKNTYMLRYLIYINTTQNMEKICYF